VVLSERVHLFMLHHSGHLDSRTQNEPTGNSVLVHGVATRKPRRNYGTRRAEDKHPDGDHAGKYETTVQRL